jgi:hypothetical protein
MPHCAVVKPPSPRSRVLLVLVMAAGLAGCSPGSDSPDAGTADVARTLAAPDATDSLLFVARSDRGSLAVRSDAGSTLDLDVVDSVTWFSDHPARDAGTSSVTDALETFGWRHNGDRLGDDPPNATLVAAELGTESVVVELLTATVDGDQVRFTVDFLGPRPASTDLSDVDVFIDDSATSPDVDLLPSGLEGQQSGGVVLGQTDDSAGHPHTLVLHLAPGVAGLEHSVLAQDEFAAVVSGGTTYSMVGDVAVGDWRFAVDSSATGDDAPIIVLKFTSREALATLAKDPTSFSQLGALTDDADGTMARLNTLIDTAASRADSGSPDAELYERLETTLTDPTWTGVLVFDASVSQLPGEVQGRSTAALADTQVGAFDIGFTVVPGAENGGSSDSFFGTVDHSGGTPPDTDPYLRALFENAALASFAMGTD